MRATVELLVEYCSASHDLEELLGADAPDIARELLCTGDATSRRRALALFQRHFELVPFDVAIELLRDSDSEAREVAFEGLYFDTVWSLSPNFLLDYEPTDDERRRMLAWEAETRDAYGDGHLATPEEMVEMLQSPDATVRSQGLRVLGFTGDPRFMDSARRAALDVNPQVRMHALRALRWMGGFTPGSDLRPLLHDESAEVRVEAEQLFRERGGR